MKAIKQFLVTLLGAIVVVIGAEVAVVMTVGKEGLRQMPVVGELFTVGEVADVEGEPEAARFEEIDALVATLKAKEALLAGQEEQLDRTRKLKADLEAIERHNKEYFDRITQLYPIIAESKRQALTALAKKYEKMTPEGAAAIFEGKSDQECAELFLEMNDRCSAKVLEAFATMGEDAIERERNRKRVTKISQLMRNTLQLSDEQAKLFTAP